MFDKIARTLALVIGVVLLLSVGCGGCGADLEPTPDAAAMLDAAPPHKLWFASDVTEGDRLAWNEGANAWYLASSNFFFFVQSSPMPPDACGVLVGGSGPVEVRPCVVHLRYTGELDPCWARDALGGVLGVVPDGECEVTEAEGAGAVARWGEVWRIER